MSRNVPTGIPADRDPIPLIAPGLEVPPVFSSGAQDAIQLLDILRGAGTLGQTVRENARQQRILNEKAKDDDRGRGARDQSTDYAVIASAIETDKLPIPVRAEDVPAFVDQIVAEKSKGFSPSYAEGYDSIRDNLTTFIVNKQLANRSRDRDELLALRGEAIATAADTDDASAILRRAREEFGSEINDTELLSKTVAPALKRAAASGDSDRVAMLKGVLGDRLPLDQQQADSMLADAKAEKQVREGAEFRRGMDARFNAVEGGRDTFTGVREHLKSIEKDTDPTMFRAAMDELNERERRAKIQADQDTFDAAVAMEQAQYDAENDAAVSAGLGFAIQDRKVKVGNRERNLNNGLEEAMDRAFARINARPDLTPDQKFAAASNIASRNGFVPPVWKRTLQAGFIAATEQALESDGKEELPPPPATIAGFDLYKRLRAASPGLLETAIPDGPDRDYYETAIVLQEDPSIGDNPTRALFQARRIMSGPGRFTTTDRKDIASAAQDITERFWSADAKNWPEVASHIARRAEVYVRTGIDPERAVERAAETVARGRINLHGWSIPTADANIPEPIRQDFRALADIMLEDWATKHGSTFGFDSGDVTLRPGMANGFWVVADGRTGLYVGGEDAVFSTNDLITRWKTDRDSDRMKKIRDAINAQSHRMENNFSNRSAFEAMRGMEVGGP